MKKIRIRTNLIFGILAIVAAVILWYLIPSQVPKSKVATEYVDGSFMPKVMSIIMGICGISCIIKDIFLKDRDEKESYLEIEIRNCIYLLMVFLYVILAINVSFMLSSILFAIISLLYMRCRNYRNYIVVVLFVVMVCLIFKFGLKVRFGGIWGF